MHKACCQGAHAAGESISLLGGTAATWPFAADAQQPDGVRRIGLLMPLAATDPSNQRQVAAFVCQLQKLGWAEGRNLQIDYRWAAGDEERMRCLQGSLLRCNRTCFSLGARQ